MLKIKVVTWSLATYAGVSFVLCVLFGLLLPDIHMEEFLEITLPAFSWLTVGSFLLGLVESVIIGAYVGIVFTLIYNFFYGRVGGPART